MRFTKLCCLGLLLISSAVAAGVHDPRALAADPFTATSAIAPRTEWMDRAVQLQDSLCYSTTGLVFSGTTYTGSPVTGSRPAEAEVQGRFEKAGAGADVSLTSSRY